MFSPSKAAKEILSTIYEKYSEKPGTMLVHTGAIGWVLSSMAQITALIFNDKITPEQKMFLIPQEVGDACVNILSFYAITESIKNIGKKLTKTGKIRSQELSKLLKDRDLFLKDKSSREAGKVYVGDWDFDITKLSDYEKNIKSVYKPLNNGVEVVTGLTGSILSSNIITPWLRNKYAAKRQQDMIARRDDILKRKQTSISEPDTIPNKPTFDSFKNLYSNGRYYTGGNMKI